MIGSTIGNVIDAKSEAIDMMLSNVAKYVAKQLVERIKNTFSSLEQFEMVREQLLTYEQFQKIYETCSPRFSLLFDTGKGYFAYCMATSEKPMRREAVTSITEHALAEIESRLPSGGATKNADFPKKKILLVDDSNFMRKTMSDLLHGDYEVLTADSGASAIRSISLTKPDLVLLDYEMPVCNGNQVLEMLRSEKDFSDIPVIFLTHRVDRESVKKVLSLKPDGYLSKSLPAESVKREIDRFFKKI